MKTTVTFLAIFMLAIGSAQLVKAQPAGGEPAMKGDDMGMDMGNDEGMMDENMDMGNMMDDGMGEGDDWSLEQDGTTDQGTEAAPSDEGTQEAPGK